jgi:hypothetical protein
MPNNSIAVLRLESGPSRAKLYMEHIMIDVANQEIVDPLKKMYTELGAAKSFIESISVEKDKGLKVNLIIDHRIAKWLEYGTQEHWISAVNAPMLQFTFRKTSMWFASTASDTGDVFTGFEVHHPGFAGYQVIPMMMDRLTQNYSKKLIEKTNKWLQESKMR